MDLENHVTFQLQPQYKIKVVNLYTSPYLLRQFYETFDLKIMALWDDTSAYSLTFCSVCTRSQAVKFA